MENGARGRMLIGYMRVFNRLLAVKAWLASSS
jgi:hypothetical protein